MVVSNKTNINILKSLVMLTDEQNCWLIGSSCLVLLAQNFKTSYYQNFNNKNENFKPRDLDFVATCNYNLLDKLLEIGTLTQKKHTRSNYRSLMFKTRNIYCISSYIFKLGSSTTLAGSIIKNMTNGESIEFNIDIIRITTETIKQSMLNWPIAETKRNFAVYCYQNELCYTEISKVSRCRYLKQKTICNMIECLKTTYHLHGSPEYSCTLTGDKINRIPYSENNELLTDDSPLGKQRRLYDVLDGNSIELAKYIDILTSVYAEIDPKQSDMDCAICMTALKDTKNKLMVLKCGHIFCVGCVMPMWISYLIMRYNRLNNFSEEDDCDANNNKCPICRKEIFKIHKNPLLNTELNIRDYGLSILNF